MKDLLMDLDVLLKEYNTSYYKQIGKPTEKSEIVGLLEENGLYLCDEFIELYLWHGWVDREIIYNDRYVELCSFGCLVDLKSAFAWFIEDKKTEKYLDGKLPIVECIDGSYLAVDLQKDSLTKGYIYACNPSITLTDKLVTTFDSIPLFVQSVLECYKQGVYVSANGKLDIDFDKEYEIFKRLNPNSIYWLDDIEKLTILEEME
ncbi:MAG: hypothetical protein K6E14_06945 [Paludibacteraceae bacterium]|nr:hypothetical protein [Paludibacteraceae bacterium]